MYKIGHSVVAVPHPFLNSGDGLMSAQEHHIGFRHITADAHPYEEFVFPPKKVIGKAFVETVQKLHYRQLEFKTQCMTIIF